VVPVDLPTLRVKEPGVAELSNYEVEINGMKTVLRLSDADAKKRGLSKPAKRTAEPKAAAKPTGK
jgi:hypothetical protein